jgi:hypothetical protein
MPGRAGEQIDHQDAHHDQPRAEHGRHVEGLTVEDPARQGDQDDADPRPDRIGDADRGRPQGEGQAIERQPVAVMTTSDGPSCVNPSAAFKAGVAITSQRMAASR